jgi:serine protease Do
VNGVVVTNVKGSSDAMQKGLVAGDVVVEINQESIKDAASAVKIVDEVKASGKQSILMLVDGQGQGDVRFVAVKFTAAKSDMKPDMKKDKTQ